MIENYRISEKGNATIHGRKVTIFKAFLREPMHDNFVLRGTYYVAGHYASDAKCIKEVLRVQNT